MMRATGTATNGEPLMPTDANEVFSTLMSGDALGRTVLDVAGVQG
jgi:hypothetical protein